jgi:hypothetical protein
MFENFTFKEASYDSVPEGTYITEFLGNEETKSKYEEGEKAVVWKWKIVEGVHTGKIVTRVTGANPTLANGCGRIIIGLLGKTPSTTESVSIKDCIGKRYIVQVVKTKDGKGTRVETVTRLP